MLSGIVTGPPDVVVVATGSEVNLALDAADAVKGKKIRVVSMMCRELYLEQESSFRESVIPPGVRVVVAEAGSRFGWEGFVGDSSDILSVDRFGESGPAAKVAEHLGFTADNLARIIQK